jgi:hypothetical protein
MARTRKNAPTPPNRPDKGDSLTPQDRDGLAGNFISEWFGHRMFPGVVATETSLNDQRRQRCPFLSVSAEEDRECIKSANSKGVCTISTTSNGQRQDWVACPYRVFDPSMIEDIATRLFLGGAGVTNIYPAPVLEDETKQEEVLTHVRDGEHVLLYFDEKLGGEIQISATPRSPQISFDVTFVELLADGDDGLRLGRFANLEVQTMDFHGTYKHAVGALTSALDLHGDAFPEQIRANPFWLGREIEGPNIANVFKRTFWQLVFKFGMVDFDACAGSALALPRSVWDSWQPFLGAPELKVGVAGVSILDEPDRADDAERLPCFIYVFDLNSTADETPSPLRADTIIQTSAHALTAHALEEAPRALMLQIETRQMLYVTIKARLQKYWKRDVALPDAVTHPEQQGDLGV